MQKGILIPKSWKISTSYNTFWLNNLYFCLLICVFSIAFERFVEVQRNRPQTCFCRLPVDCYSTYLRITFWYICHTFERYWYICTNFWVFSKCCTTLNPFSVTKRTIHNKLQRVKQHFAMEIHQRLKLKRAELRDCLLKVVRLTARSRMVPLYYDAWPQPVWRNNIKQSRITEFPFPY